MKRLAASAVESAVPMAKPFSTERRLEARGGADGSVISSSGNAGCTTTVWPGLLK